MTRWLRLYSDAPRNPKVASLSDQDHRLWIELLCVSADNEGLIPPLEALKRLLKRRSDHLYASLNRLVKAGLIDPLEDAFTPHNWLKRQYKSDSSTDRVKRFRNAKRNVSETPPETETETETDYSIPTEQNKRTRAPRRAAPVQCPDDVSQQVWDDFKTHRKTPLTATAIEGFRREATKAALTLQEAIEHTIAQGWQGFKAEWIRNDGRQQNGSRFTANVDRRDGSLKACDRRLEELAAAERGDLAGMCGDGAKRARNLVDGFTIEGIAIER